MERDQGSSHHRSVGALPVLAVHCDDAATHRSMLQEFRDHPQGVVARLLGFHAPARFFQVAERHNRLPGSLAGPTQAAASQPVDVRCISVAVLVPATRDGARLGVGGLAVTASPQEPPGVLDQKAVVVFDRPEERTDNRGVGTAPSLPVEPLHQRVEALVIFPVRDRADGAYFGAGRGVETVFPGGRFNIGVQSGQRLAFERRQRRLCAQ